MVRGMAPPSLSSSPASILRMEGGMPREKRAEAGRASATLADLPDRALVVDGRWDRGKGDMKASSSSLPAEPCPASSSRFSTEVLKFFT